MKADELFPRLLNALERNRLGHGLFIYGSAESEWENTPAFQNFLKTFLCAQVQSLAQNNSACGQCESCLGLALEAPHPDFMSLRPESQSKGYQMEQIRQLLHVWQLSRALSPRKLLWIQQAHHLSSSNQGPANTLLKTLEEPRPDCFLIISSEKPDQVLPTLRSRCQAYFLSPQYSKQESVEQELQPWMAFLNWFRQGCLLGQRVASPADKEAFWKERDQAVLELRLVQNRLWQALKMDSSLESNHERNYESNHLGQQLLVMDQMEELFKKLSFYANPSLQWSEFRLRVKLGL